MLIPHLQFLSQHLLCLYIIYSKYKLLSHSPELQKQCELLENIWKDSRIYMHGSVFMHMH